jgi:hypothetical protein
MRLSFIVFLFVLEILFQFSSSCCFGQSKRMDKRKSGSIIVEAYTFHVLLSEIPSDTIKLNLVLRVFRADSTAIERVYAFRGKDFVQYEFKDNEIEINGLVVKEDFYMDGDNILYVEAGQWYYEVLLIPNLYSVYLMLEKETEGILRVVYNTGPVYLE